MEQKVLLLKYNRVLYCTNAVYFIGNLLHQLLNGCCLSFFRVFVGMFAVLCGHAAVVLNRLHLE